MGKIEIPANGNLLRIHMVSVFLSFSKRIVQDGDIAELTGVSTISQSGQVLLSKLEDLIAMMSSLWEMLC